MLRESPHDKGTKEETSSIEETVGSAGRCRVKSNREMLDQDTGTRTSTEIELMYLTTIERLAIWARSETHYVKEIKDLAAHASVDSVNHTPQACQYQVCAANL